MVHEKEKHRPPALPLYNEFPHDTLAIVKNSFGHTGRSRCKNNETWLSSVAKTGDQRIYTAGSQTFNTLRRGVIRMNKILDSSNVDESLNFVLNRFGKGYKERPHAHESEHDGACNFRKFPNQSADTSTANTIACKTSLPGVYQFKYLRIADFFPI
jgi:hypothetical protein